MKILVSKAFLKWQKANKSNKPLADVIDRFLLQVYNASSIANVTPQPKAAGKNLRKTPGTVDEFTLNKSYRIYAKCVESEPSVIYFYIAVVGIKGSTNQNADILAALNMFDNIATEAWHVWEPSAALLATYSDKEATDDSVPVQTDTLDATEPKQKSKKPKGKPVDENGLTVKERKALRKEQQQKEREQKLAAERAARLQSENDADKVTPDTMDDATMQNVPAAAVSATAQKNRQLVSKTKQEIAALQTVFKLENEPKPMDAENTPGQDDVSDNEIRIIGGSRSEPQVAVNNVPQPQPEQITGDVKFEPVTDVQYELAIIEHNMNIEQSRIVIAQQMIAVEQSKIAMEKLAIQKLKLLQQQRIQNAHQ